MKINLHLCCFAIAPVALLSTNCFAEGTIPSDAAAKKAIGTLSDGAAFRRDADGNQIVDQIAELEVGLDGIKRQVHSLENDIDKDKTTSGVKAVIRDGDELFDGNQSQKTAAAAPNCSLEISAIRRKIIDLEVELRNSKFHAQSLGKTQAQNISATVRNSELDEVALVQDGSLVKEAEAEVDVGEQPELTEVSANTEVRYLQDRLASQIEREKDLTNEIVELHNEISSLNKKVEKSNELVDETLASRGRSANRGRYGAEGIVSAKSAKSQNGFDEQSVESARAEFSQELKKINKLVAERDKAFELSGSNDVLKVEPVELETATKTSYDELKAEVARLDGNSNIPSIRRDLAEIDNLLVEDIKLANKVGDIY